MTNTTYTLQGDALTLHQSNYLRTLSYAQSKVEFTKFAVLQAEVDAYRVLASKADEVLGEGAVAASKDILSAGWRLWDEYTREVLSAVHYIELSRVAEDMALFLEASNRFSQYVWDDKYIVNAIINIFGLDSIEDDEEYEQELAKFI